MPLDHLYTTTSSFKELLNSECGTVQLMNATINATTSSAPFIYPMTWNQKEMQELVYPIILYIIGMVYTFFAIAIICDEFFVPALERICDKFPITPDVAGATLMAAGGSAPELATSFVGTAYNSPVGFGTIVGSAVFNVLFVIGACAFAAPEELELDWWPLFRDSSYYCFSLIILTIFFGVVSKNRIFWYESLVLFLLYVLYVFLMSKNEILERKITGCVNSCRRQKQELPIHPEPGSGEEEKQPLAKQPLAEEEMPAEMPTEIPVEAEVHLEMKKAPEDPVPALEKPAMPQKLADVEASIVKEPAGDAGGDVDGGDGDDEEDEGAFELAWPTKEAFAHEEKCPECKLACSQVAFVLLFPLNALFFFTVPDVRRETSMLCGQKVVWEDMWLPAFAMSIIWIGAFSYFMVWWAELVGLATTLPSTVLGLTILAPATSIPDLLSSIFVARKGEGNMAVSSSIGSNIFDILIGLPIPWFVFSVVKGVQNFGKCRPVTTRGEIQNAHSSDHFCFSVAVYADTLLFSVCVLIFMIALVISTVHCSGWKMTKGLGIAMFGLYVVFVVQDLIRNCEILPHIAKYFTFLNG